MGGGEKTKKKFMQTKIIEKKIRAKKKAKKKNSCIRKSSIQKTFYKVFKSYFKYLAVKSTIKSNKRKQMKTIEFE